MLIIIFVRYEKKSVNSCSFCFVFFSTCMFPRSETSWMWRNQNSEATNVSLSAERWMWVCRGARVEADLFFTVWFSVFNPRLPLNNSARLHVFEETLSLNASVDSLHTTDRTWNTSGENETDCAKKNLNYDAISFIVTFREHNWPRYPAANTWSSFLWRKVKNLETGSDARQLCFSFFGITRTC